MIYAMKLDGSNFKSTSVPNPPTSWIPEGWGIVPQEFHQVVECNFPHIQMTVEGNIITDVVAVAPPAPSSQTLAQGIRTQRDTLLSQSDWTQMGDSPLTENCKVAFTTYRQALRDITAQDDFPCEVEWPEIPMVENIAGSNV